MKGTEIDAAFGGTGREVLWSEGRWNIYIQAPRPRHNYILLHKCEKYEEYPLGISWCGLMSKEDLKYLNICEQCEVKIPDHIQALIILMDAATGD